MDPESVNPQIVATKGPLCEGCPRYSEYRCLPAVQSAATRCDVLIIGEQPDEKSAVNNRAFFGHGGTVLNKAIEAVISSDPRYKGLDIRKTYAVQCMATDEGAPSKVVMAQCSTYMEGLIAAWKPKIIVALGSSALRQLGLKVSFNDARGKLYTHLKSMCPILVSFSEKALMAAPGVYDTFRRDMVNAFRRAVEGEVKAKSLEELTQNYRIPTTVDDALAVCKYIEEYTREGTNTPAEKWAISVDTETTTLRPEKQTARIIAFCFGWDTGKATTILYDHPNAPEEYLARLPEIHDAIARVLGSNKPKILHNYKFDGKFIELKYAFKFNNVAWDTLLGEHLLDEDKKGNYGLKALTATFLPEYVGYEDRLYDLLKAEEGIAESDEVEKEIDDLEEILKEDHPQFLENLRAYKEDLSLYEDALPEELAALNLYARQQADYAFCREYLNGRVAAWEIAVADWPKGKRGKPPRPKKWFSKPEKPVISKKPKRPEDPRTKKEKQIAKDAGFENVPLRDLQIYGAIDADVTRQMTLIQRARIQQEASQVASLMRTHAIPASRVLGRMEFYGTRVDHGYLPELTAGLQKVADATNAELYDMAGRTRDGKDLNLNSPTTLADVLYTWGWTHPDGVRVTYEERAKTKKGHPSTAEKTLRTYIEYEDQDKKIPTHDGLFAERLILWRKSNKALSTFLANTRALSKRDGFLHTQFHLNGTGTGRLSSSDMNMQNLPKFLANFNIKKLFIPDSDEYVIVNIDYKGAEVRVFTAYAHDQALIDALNAGLDMHSFFAHKVFARPYEMYDRRDDATFIPDKALRKLLDTERSRIKRVVFGILYGAGPAKIAETIGVTETVAQELIDLLYDMFPAIKQYALDVEKLVMAQGWVETHFKRRRRFPLARISRHRGRAIRQARNFLVQSTSSDIVIGQLIEMDEPLRHDIGGRMLLTVHDSLVLQWPKKHLLQLKDFVKQYAEDSVAKKYPWLPVPFKSDTECGPSYGECQNIDKYLAKHTFIPKTEGVIEEHEYLTELREDAFVDSP
jgi:uracil-DNA glycosylase family 4